MRRLAYAGRMKHASTPTLNPDVIDTASPPIPEAKAWAAGYAGAHGPLIDLSQAVPGLPPPDELLAAHAEAAREAASAQYGPITGDAAFRKAFSQDVALIYGQEPGLDEIAITAGCNQAFVVTMMALAKAGERVILPAPWYFNHQMTLQMLGIEACPLPCHAVHGFVPRLEDAERLIDSRTRALVLVSPNNPTGAVYPPDLLRRFAELCVARGIWLVLDETYRDFLPDGAGPPHDLFGEARLRPHLIQLYSFSKAWAVPGWRLGSVIAPAGAIEQIGKWLDCIQICPARAGQVALARKLPELGLWREGNRAVINARAKVFREAMAGLNDWRVAACGAYFAYVEHPFPDMPAALVAERLVRQRGVLTLPGPCFGPGQERFLRIAIANVADEAIRGLPGRLGGFGM
jgi:aspartate/methionine/tyrosine aminotransferase